MKKLSKIIVAAVMALSTSAIALTPSASIYADDAFCTNPNLSDEERQFLGCSLKKNAAESTVQNVANVVIGFLSVIALAFIVKGGIDYMTCAAHPDKLKRAKFTIIYAVAGLVICTLAFAIVNWVISGVGQATAQ